MVQSGIGYRRPACEKRQIRGAHIRFGMAPFPHAVRVT
jgi:hypothetical protein